MSPNESPDISNIIEKAPEVLKPEALKQKLYSVLEGRGYILSKSRIPGYHECVTQEGVEICGVILDKVQGVRVDVSILVNNPEERYFGIANTGGLYFLVPKDQIYCTEDNLTETIEKLVQIGDIGMRVVRSNPDKRIV